MDSAAAFTFSLLSFLGGLSSSFLGFADAGPALDLGPGLNFESGFLGADLAGGSESSVPLDFLPRLLVTSLEAFTSTEDSLVERTLLVTFLGTSFFRKRIYYLC